MRPHLALAVVLAGALVAPLDSSVNVAFPAITQVFGLELPAIRWLVILYALAYGALMLVGGRLGDLHGYRRVFGAGLGLVAASSTACALAPTYEALLAARAAQGVGTALVLGCGPALALSLFPEGSRTRVLGWYASVFALGSALGLLAGGVLVDAWGWPSVFWMRVPVALAVLALLHRVPAARPLSPDRAFDTPGAVLLAVWISALVLALAQHGAAAPWLALLAAGALGAFVVHESRTAEPILRPALFREARFAVLNLLNVAAHVTAFAVMLLGPYYFARVAGLDALGIGLQLAIWAGGSITGASLAGPLGRRVSLRRVGFFGVALCVAGLALVATWNAQTALAVAGAALFLHGFGLGLFQVVYADRVVATLPREDRGVAGSLTMLARMLGVVLGAALFTMLFRDAEGRALASGLAAGDAFVEGFRYAFRCAAAGLAVCLALALWSGRQNGVRSLKAKGGCQEP